MQDIKRNRELQRDERELSDALDEKERMLRKENNEDFIGMKLAAQNDDKSEYLTYKGRRISLNRARHNPYITEHKDKDPFGIKAVARGLTDLGYSIAFIYEWAQRTSFKSVVTAPLSNTFGNKAQELEKFADAEFIYEGEDVSAETARLLNNRMARILRAKKELENITDPIEYAEKKDLFDRLVERSGVRAHDRVGFAFAPEKVAKLENVFKPDDMDCSGVVCVYRPRANAHDSRKMKVDVADQYDQDPTETIGEVNGAPAVAIPIAIPTFAIK